MAAEADGQLLAPQGNETMEQEDVEAQTPEASSVEAGGTPAYDGRYTRYTFHGVFLEVPSHYVPLQPIGRGAYGIVCSVRNTRTGEEVAMKKIGNAFADRTDAKRTLREIILLRSMNHPNVMTLKDLIRPPNPRNFKDVYLVNDLMPTDLHEVIRSGQALDERHFKFILYQLLRGLKYIHSANILHRDLKPPNILIDARCNVKITDFGLARTRVGFEDHMTEYVVTRYYRGPELLVNNQEYGPAVDVWSLGCIYLELVFGQILLRGENYVDQLRKTCELVGTPSLDELSFIQNEGARNFILNDLPPAVKQPFAARFPTLSEHGADLCERMLMFDPRRRITVDEALNHPYLAHYHNMNEEPVHPNPFRYDLSFEQEEFTVARIRQLIYEQSCLFNP